MREFISEVPLELQSKNSDKILFYLLSRVLEGTSAFLIVTEKNDSVLLPVFYI